MYYRTWGGKKDTAEGCARVKWSSSTLMDKADPSMAGLDRALPKGVSPHAMAISPPGDYVAVGDCGGVLWSFAFACVVAGGGGGWGGVEWRDRCGWVGGGWGRGWYT